MPGPKSVGEQEVNRPVLEVINDQEQEFELQNIDEAQLEQMFDQDQHQRHSQGPMARNLTLDNKQKLDNKWDEIGENMPESLQSVRLKQLLSRKDRKVSEGGNKQKKREAVSEAQAEVDEINEVLMMYELGELDRYHIKKNEVDIKALNFKKARDLVQILINDDSKKDSPLMKDVKTDVVKLQLALDEYKNKPASIKNMDVLSGYFELAINSCQNYLQTRHSTRKVGMARAKMVSDVMLSMLIVRDGIRMVREGGAQNGMEGLDGLTMGQFLHMSPIEEAPQQAQQENVELNAYGPQNLSADARILYKICGTNYDYTKSISGKGVSEKKRKAEVKRIVAFKDVLKSFVPGVTEVKEVEITGSKIRLLQRADNSLYLIDGHEQILLGKSAQLLYTQIEGDMMKKSDIYGNEEMSVLINEYLKYNEPGAKLTSAEHSRVRANLTELLSSRLKLNPELFNNVRRSEMAVYAGQLLRGEITEDQLRVIIQNTVKSENLINGIALTETMELDSQRINEINAHVSIYETQRIADENDWSPEEKAVRELMADFVFAEDTQIMDLNANHPEEFVRTILQKNAGALATLIKQGKGDEDDLISGIFKKMSLDQVHGEGEESFEKTIANSVRQLCTFFATKVDKNLSVEEIKTGIENMLSNKADQELTQRLVSANSSMEDGIKKSCEIMQKNVSEISKSIFAESLKYGNDKLDDILKNAAFTDSGQGKFTRKVFDNYFKKVKVIDQRSMLSAVLRGARKVDQSYYSDMELLAEIRSRRLAKYPTLIQTNRDFGTRPITKEERDQINEYRKEKEKLKVGANYLAGLIRGAGPLFQKMIQGLPEETLPVEIRMAVRDVKSKLPPIPERVVKSQLFAMIGRSGGTVDRIEVIKSLGAATVGQTFKCKLFGPNLPPEGRNVVIKLLRPDVQNRMQREAEVMKECAGMVDESMKATYEGQLTNYTKELDLSKEAKNIKDGEIYNGKFENVEVEKINTLIDYDVNSLVLEEAPGRTLDDILLDAEKFRADVKRDLYTVEDNEGNKIVLDVIKFDHKFFDKTKKNRKLLIDKINELIKQRDIMANICNAWITQAIIKSGYYHADLHAGNILIGEEKGTLIDFGNAVQFDGDQQAAITQMTTAAAVGDIDLYFSAFNSLLEEECGEDVKTEFAKILKMGTEEDAGQRISATLIKAMEMGVKLPPSIYNFSQGQLRLQKSINDINNMINDLNRDVSRIDNIQDTQNKIDAISIVTNEAVNKVNALWASGIDVVFTDFIGNYLPVDHDEFIKDLLDNEVKEANLEEGIEKVDKRADFENKYMGNMSNLENKLNGLEAYLGGWGDGGNNGKFELPDFSKFRPMWNEFKEKWKGKEGTKELANAASSFAVEMAPMNHNNEGYKKFGGTDFLVLELMDALEHLDENRVNEILEVYEKKIPLALRVQGKIKQLRDLQDKNKKPSEAVKAQIGQLAEEIYTEYNELHSMIEKVNPVATAFASQIVNFNYVDQYREWLSGMFAEETTTKVMENGQEVEKKLGELFKEKFEEYAKLGTPYAVPGTSQLRDDTPYDIKKQVRQKRMEMIELHHQISKIQLIRYTKGRFDIKASVKSYDFSKIMKDVVFENPVDFGLKLGIMNGIKLGLGQVLMNLKKNKK